MDINYNDIEKFESLDEFYDWFNKYDSIDYDKCLEIYNKRYIQAIKKGKNTLNILLSIILLI